MNTEAMYRWATSSISGIVCLSAIGSLVSAGVVYVLVRLIRRYRKAVQEAREFKSEVLKKLASEKKPTGASAVFMRYAVLRNQLNDDVNDVRVVKFIALLAFLFTSLFNMHVNNIDLSLGIYRVELSTREMLAVNTKALLNNSEFVVRAASGRAEASSNTLAQADALVGKPFMVLSKDKASTSQSDRDASETQLLKRWLSVFNWLAVLVVAGGMVAVARTQALIRSVDEAFKVNVGLEKSWEL